VIVVAGAAALSLDACGRRALDGSHADAAAVGEGDAGSSKGAAGAAGGAPGNAGVSGGSGAPGNAGVSGGGGAGQGGAAGAPCGPCPSPICQPGFERVVDPAVSCCALCRRIDCSLVDCTPPTCPSGFHAEKLEGQCCPICLPGATSMACLEGRATYARTRDQLIDKYSRAGCQVDHDCTLVYESNACVSNCGTAFLAGLAENAIMNLTIFANEDCSTCPKPEPPPCAPVVAVCSNGRCTAGSPSH
jgi:hypothetical protein